MLYQNFTTISNIAEIQYKVSKEGYLVSLYTAGVAVDSFFLMGGLLTAYLGTSVWATAVKGGRPLNVLKSYFLFVLNRYARLTPILALGMWSQMSFWPIIGTGPKFEVSTSGSNFRLLYIFSI